MTVIQNVGFCEPYWNKGRVWYAEFVDGTNKIVVSYANCPEAKYAVEKVCGKKVKGLYQTVEAVECFL